MQNTVFFFQNLALVCECVTPLF